MKTRSEELIVALDIGSSKISTAISEIDEYGNIFVLGMGNVETKGGIRGGVIINIESIVAAINSAKEDAEIQAGREIKGVFVGISGTHIETINSKGVVAISGHNKEISSTDVNRVIEAAKAVAIPMDREVLHIIPQTFIVDSQQNIKYPIGMVGTRLECQIHMITTPISSIQNVVRCLERCDIEIYDIVLQNIAAAKACLEEDEKELGVLMIDFGSETAKATLYYRGSPFYQAIYPLGGYLITNDIAAGLKVSLQTAEKIKLAHGVTDFEYVDKSDTIQIPSIGGRKPILIARENLVHIIKPRVEEIFNFIKSDIGERGYLDKIPGGVVITGGSANLPGMTEVCQEVFNVQARVGIPKKLSGLGDQMNMPEYSVLNGLLRWGYDRLNIKPGRTAPGKIVKNDNDNTFFKSIKKFINELF